MAPIPLHRVTIVRPFVRYLSCMGSPVERGFRKAGLPVTALDNLQLFVPSARFWTFVGYMAATEGIEDLGFRVGQAYGADCADTNLSSLLRRSPTLYDGLMKASAFHEGSTSRSHIGLVHPPSGAYTHFCHQPSFDRHTPNFEQINWFGLTALIDMVRVFTGPQWQPVEIGLATPHAPCRAIREQLPDTRILTSQPCSYIAIENELLSHPSLSRKHSAPVSSDYDTVADDFASSLRMALQSYMQESNLSIEFAAELCNSSTRNLQRKLAAAGTRYSEILDQIRFNTASELLQHPDIKITDIALQLGYSDSAHFTRAFRRIAGITPRIYRRQFERLR